MNHSLQACLLQVLALVATWHGTQGYQLGCGTSTVLQLLIARSTTLIHKQLEIKRHSKLAQEQSLDNLYVGTLSGT